QRHERQVRESELSAALEAIGARAEEALELPVALLHVQLLGVLAPGAVEDVATGVLLEGQTLALNELPQLLGIGHADAASSSSYAPLASRANSSAMMASQRFWSFFRSSQTFSLPRHSLSWKR